MKKAFKKITNFVIGVSVLSLIIGLVFIIYPSMSLKTLGIISALYLIVHGLVMLSLELRISKIYVPYESMLLSVLSIVLGAVLLKNPKDASLLITVAFGVWIIVSSINNIKVAYFFRKLKSFPSTLLIVLGILDIILGCLVIIDPFTASISLVLYLGIVLIIHAIFNIVSMIVLNKNIKDKENYFKEKLSKLIPNLD